MTRKQKAIQIINFTKLEARFKQRYIDIVERHGVRAAAKAMLQYLPEHAFDRGYQAALEVYSPEDYSKERYDKALNMECHRERIIGGLLDLLR